MTPGGEGRGGMSFSVDQAIDRMLWIRFESRILLSLCLFWLGLFRSVSLLLFCFDFRDTIDRGCIFWEGVLYLKLVFVFVNITRRRGKLSRAKTLYSYMYMKWH